MEHAWSVKFVNREEELAAIQAQLQAWDTRRMLFISGEGGIGKTRLLNEVMVRFAGGPEIHPLKIPAIIDFDDDRYKLFGNIRFALARQLDIEAFDPYFEASRDLHLAEQRWGQVNLSLVTRKALTVNRTFAECFNKVSQQSRVLLRFDTADALPSDNIISSLLDMIVELENVLLLLTGRNAGQLYQKFKDVLGNDAAWIPLKPFALSNSLEYLALKQESLKVTLDKAWVKKLFILAGGLPVLIDLAIEWAQGHRPLTWMEGLSLADLQGLEQASLSGDPQAKMQLESIREQFKRETVMPIAQLQSPLDQLKLVLAKVYPLDLEGMMEMLNLSRQRATELMAQAKNSVSVKILPDARIKLHDEVQRLVNEYVWKHLDPHGHWEQRDSRRAVRYLTQKSTAILNEIQVLKRREQQLMEAADPAMLMEAYSDRREKEIEFWTLRGERLRRQLESDIHQGYALFEQDYALARTDVASLSARNRLLSTIAPYAHLDEPRPDIQGQALTEQERLTVQRAIAEEATNSGKYTQAAQIYESLLSQLPPDSEQYIDALNGQANQLVRAGKLQDALRVNEQALRLSQQQGFEGWVVTSTLEIGWVHRLMGHLDIAQQRYAEALRMAMGRNDMERVAQIYNNLAYVHALQHQERALAEIQQAIGMWQKLARQQEGYRIQLGQCYNVAGEVCLELGHPEEALTYFELSGGIFDIEESERSSQEKQVLEWRSKSRSGRGCAYWQLAGVASKKGDVAAAQQHLVAARDDLEWASENAAPFDSPAILNRLGEVCFLQERYAEAASVWWQSMQEAQQVGDAFIELQSLNDLARLAFYYPLEHFETWRAFETYYHRDYRRRQRGLYFELLHGLLYAHLGHLALKEEQLKEATKLYDTGLSVLSKAEAYAPFSMTKQLTFMQKQIFPQIRPETVQQLGMALQEIWMRRGQDITALAYFWEWMHWGQEA